MSFHGAVKRVSRFPAGFWVFFMAVVVYLPICGWDLHTDDFSRILDNSELSTEYFRSLLKDTKSDGFYRPLNHLSFGLIHHIFGLSPRAHGGFNFLLLACSALLVYRIALRLSAGDVNLGVLWACAWLAILKPLSLSLTWAVGRTTGLYCFFALAGVALALRFRQRPAAAGAWFLPGLCVFMALLCKESAVVSGAFVLVAAVSPWRLGHRPSPASLSFLLLGLACAYGVYLWLRGASLAMSVQDAPPYYRWNLHPLHLLDQVRGYFTKGSLFSLLPPVLACLILRRGEGLTPPEQRTTWLWRSLLCLCGFLVAAAPMVPVPAKSNLYAYAPGILVAACWVTLCRSRCFWPVETTKLHPRLLGVVLLSTLILAPIGWRQGAVTHAKNRHTLDWLRTLESSVDLHTETRLVLELDPAQFPNRVPNAEHIEYLRIALKIRGFSGTLHVQAPSADGPAPQFRLRPLSQRHRLGALEPIVPSEGPEKNP